METASIYTTKLIKRVEVCRLQSNNFLIMCFHSHPLPDPRLGTSGRQMTQLQILYKARGKRIDELTRELEDIKADAARQNRMTNHQLAIARGEFVFVDLQTP